MKTSPAYYIKLSYKIRKIKPFFRPMFLCSILLKYTHVNFICMRVYYSFVFNKWYSIKLCNYTLPIGHLRDQIQIKFYQSTVSIPKQQYGTITFFTHYFVSNLVFAVATKLIARVIGWMADKNGYDWRAARAHVMRILFVFRYDINDYDTIVSRVWWA